MLYLSRRRSGRRLMAVLALSALAQAPFAAEARPRAPEKTKVAAKPTEATAKRKDDEKTAPVAAKRGGPLFAVVIGPGPSWKKGQPLKKGSDGHWKYWQDLHAKGVVDSAGPVGQDTGFVLLRARNQREANAVIAADPAVRAGKFRGVARPYDPAFGN